ncbi:hypothetical protein [Haloglomus salinum]|uniref:hypothetical protein n=1 Tax=Haloglomus salinum TaxID=2962673 RepID=UPI0020C9A4C6|nr:hypothetical protein [Haloglomus salinum]
MRLFTQLDPETYENIESLVSEGEYESVDQFLRVAAQNQLAIERSEGGTQTTLTDSQGKDGQKWEYDIPQSVAIIEKYPDNENKLLFSQYYRFFPLKCALYLLAKELAGESQPITLDTARETVEAGIRPIRDRIVEWEQMNDVEKKNKISTGFPKIDSSNPERSRRRYLNHYVGRARRERGDVAGFGFDMGYLAVEYHDHEPHVAFTPAGFEFLQYTNPVLSHGPEAPTLSEQERDYIVASIRRVLPMEYKLIQRIYGVLSEGTGSYTDHLDEFKPLLKSARSSKDELTENYVRSHIGGAISRMVELDILQRGQRRGWYDPAEEPEGIRPPKDAEHLP